MNTPYRTMDVQAYRLTLWRRFLCAIGRHEYVWDPTGKRVIMPARSIRVATRLENRLVCAHCPMGVGPQPGISLIGVDEVNWKRGEKRVRATRKPS